MNFNGTFVRNISVINHAVVVNLSVGFKLQCICVGVDRCGGEFNGRHFYDKVWAIEK